MCSTTVAIYTQAETNTLATHRARVAEVRDVFMSDCIVASITDDSTETLTCLAVQNYSFAQRVEDGYFIGEISFDVVCYRSERYSQAQAYVDSHNSHYASPVPPRFGKRRSRRDRRAIGSSDTG